MQTQLLTTSNQILTVLGHIHREKTHHLNENFNYYNNFYENFDSPPSDDETLYLSQNKFDLVHTETKLPGSDSAQLQSGVEMMVLKDNSTSIFRIRAV